MYFLFSDGGSPRLAKNAEVELAMKHLHPTSIENTFVIQPFLTNCSRRSSYFSNIRWCAHLKFSSKWTVNSIMKTFFALTDQMTISGCFVVNVVSVGNMKLWFKSVAMCQSVQPLSNDGLRIFYIYVYIYIRRRSSKSFIPHPDFTLVAHFIWVASAQKLRQKSASFFLALK